MTTEETLKTLQQEALATEQYDKLQLFFNTPEYKALPYITRNAGFITSHKLKAFLRCPWCYEKKYIKGVPDRTEDDEKDAFVIGQAFDDFITEGPDYFASKYQRVGVRNAKAREEHAGKKLLTAGLDETIHSLTSEFRQNPLFFQNPKKKILFFKIGEGGILKIEMDGFQPDDRLIVDLKSCANIIDAKPDDYAFQLSFYAFVVQQALGIKCEAEIQLIDKHSPFSRSRAFRYLVPTLESNFGEIINGIDQLLQATKLGFFPSRKNETFEDQKILWNCPYYGIEGHGRETKPIYY